MPRLVLVHRAEHHLPEHEIGAGRERLIGQELADGLRRARNREALLDVSVPLAREQVFQRERNLAALPQVRE